MKKPASLLVLLLFMGSIKLFAEKIKFEGKTYLLYPYKQEMKYYGPSGSDMPGIPFYPLKLEDGNYVVLFAEPALLATKMDKQANKMRAMFKSNIAATCTIKNGKLEGTATFYSHKLKRSKQLVWGIGNYQNGKMHGRWAIYNFSRYGLLQDSIHFFMENGLKNGEYKHIDFRGNVLEFGNFKNELKHGLWKSITTYYTSWSTYENGKLHGLETDSLHAGYKLQRMYNHGEFTGEAQYYSSKLNTGKNYLLFQIKILDTNILQHIHMEDSSRLYHTEYSRCIGGLFSESLSRFLDIFQLESNYNIRNTILSKSQYNVEELDSNGKVISIFHFISNKMRTTEYDNEKVDYWPTRKKYSNYSVKSNLPNGKTRYYYESRMRVVNEAVSTNATLGKIYHSYNYAPDDPYQKYNETYYYIYDFTPVIIAQNIINYERISKYRYGKEVTKFTYSPEWYVWKNQQLPKGIFLVDSISNYRKTYGFFDTAGAFFGLNLYKAQDERLHAITGFNQFEYLDSNHVMYQRIETIAYKNNIVDFVSTDTILLGIAGMELGTKSTHDFFIGSQMQSELYSVTLPSKHSRVYFNGKLYTGDLSIYQYKGTIENQIKVKNKSAYNQHITIKYGDGRYEYARRKKNLSHICNLSFTDGMANSYAYIYEMNYGKRYYNSQKIEGFYLDGSLEGNLLRTNYENVLKFQFHHGQREGLQEYVRNSSNHLIGYHFYMRNQKIAGPALFREEDKEFTFNVENNIITGPYRQITSGYITDSAEFVNGVLHGAYASYYYSNDYYGRFKIVPQLKAKLRHGALIDTVKTYFIDGNLSTTVVIKDSFPLIQSLTGTGENGSYVMVLAKHWVSEIRYNDGENVEIANKHWDKNNPISKSKSQQKWLLTMADTAIKTGTSNPQMEYNLSFMTDISGNCNASSNGLIGFDNAWNGHYTYRYKSGVVSQIGNADSGRRVGGWKFYTEIGKLFKEIDYTKGTFHPEDDLTKSLNHNGFCKGYDNNGRKLYEGYIIDESFSNICATDANITFEQLYYTAVYDSFGNNILTFNAKTPVCEYQLSGSKIFDGWIYKGLRDSTWYFYSAGGTLNSAGKYDSGLLDGRWISGDLQGINYIDNACFNEDDAYKVRELMNELDFVEEIYNKGILLRKTETSVSLQGVSRDYYGSYFRKYKNIPWHWAKRKIKRLAYNDGDYYDEGSYSSRAHDISF